MKKNSPLRLLAGLGFLSLCLTACTTTDGQGGDGNAFDDPGPGDPFYYGGPNFGGGDVINAPLPAPAPLPPRRSPTGR